MSDSFEGGPTDVYQRAEREAQLARDVGLRADGDITQLRSSGDEESVQLAEVLNQAAVALHNTMIDLHNAVKEKKPKEEVERLIAVSVGQRQIIDALYYGVRGGELHS